VVLDDTVNKLKSFRYTEGVHRDPVVVVDYSVTFLGEGLTFI